MMMNVKVKTEPVPSMNVKIKTEPVPMTIPTPTIPMTIPTATIPTIPNPTIPMTLPMKVPTIPTPKTPTPTIPMTVPTIPTPKIPMTLPVVPSVSAQVVKAPKSYIPGTYFSRVKFGFMKRMKREFGEEKVREYWYNNLCETTGEKMSCCKMRLDASKPLKHSFVIRHEMKKKRNVIDRVQGRVLSFEFGGRIKKDPKVSKKENKRKGLYKRRYKKRGKYKPRVLKIPANMNIIGNQKKSKKLVRKRGRPKRENRLSKGSNVFDNPEFARNTIKNALKMGYKGSYMDVRDGNLLMNLRKPGSKVEIDPISRRRNLMNPDRGHVTEPGLCNYYSRMKPRTSTQVSDNLLLLAFTSVDD